MLPHDFDLTSAHLQALSSREAVVAFFAQLGYNTEARLKQTSAALGFSDVLVHEVTHVERVADHENGELQVYLLEMKQVTVALRRALARSLRNYLGDHQKGEGELTFEEVVDILHKNRTRLGISLSEARVMARLRTEYEKSVETLKPLKAQLA